VLLPAVTIYRGTQKHYSLVKVLFALYHNMRYNASMMKKKTSIRYSAEAKDLLEKLAKKMGISQSAVLELAIRALAKQEGIA
jgi:TRAP-type C4-dicarboxylate transport system substrate-binding protein